MTLARRFEWNGQYADLVERAEEWRWGSCYARQHYGHPLVPLLSDWPIDRTRGWLELVNQSQTPAEERVEEQTCTN